MRKGNGDTFIAMHLPAVQDMRTGFPGQDTTISSSVIPFFFCLQSFPELGSFPKSQFFALGGQSIGVSASASFLPKNTQD